VSVPRDALDRYLALLTTWNRRINLTGARDPEEIRRKHFDDSFAVVAHLPAEAKRLVDVGSGAGFPGAIIALARPELEVTLVESNQKKVAFLRALVRELSLANVLVMAERIEALRERDGFQPFDVAISRATFSVPEWLELGPSLVGPGGLVIAMEGAELNELPEGATRVELKLPGASRHLVLFGNIK
jgi:16S rRNA (guanine527-N7)-methyltransferase